MGQEPVLYARSIKENIAYGLDKWDLDLVQNAATMANAHQFISEMNRQYDTETGEKGLQMSGMATPYCRYESCLFCIQCNCCIW